MQTEGAFCWWYLDLVDEEGNGIVLIWSFGLPFLPGARREERPRARPAISLACYRDGQTEVYLLQELTPEQVAVGDGPSLEDGLEWSFGDSRMSLRSVDGALHVDVDIDLAMPATSERLCGRIRASGPLCSLSKAVQRSIVPHRWSPILVGGRGDAVLSHGDRAWTVRGRAYVDANVSAKPLHRLGVAEWRWGRVTVGEYELIYYVLYPSSEDAPEVRWVFLVRSDGSVQQLSNVTLGWHEARRAIFGVRYHRHVHIQAEELDVVIAERSRVDDGPFYVRSLVEAHCLRTGSSGSGVAELVVPDRVDVAWQRPFVRMRVHRPGGDSSMWLPLFSGGRRGRVRRLFSQLWAS